MKKYKEGMVNTKVRFTCHCQYASTDLLAGTWIPLDAGRELAFKNNILDRLRPIFDYTASDVSPPPAPKHPTNPSRPKVPKAPVVKKAAGIAMSTQEQSTR